MLHGPIPDPGMERRRRVMRCLLVLAAIAGYGVARPDAVAPAVSLEGEEF